MLMCVFTYLLKALVRAIIACMHKIGWNNKSCHGDKQLLVIAGVLVTHSAYSRLDPSIHSSTATELIR